MTFASSQYINWEREPNEAFTSDNYLVSYSFDSALNKGYLPRSDQDIWYFIAREENPYKTSMKTPENFFYDFVAYEILPGETLVKVAEAIGTDTLKEVTVPGGDNSWHGLRSYYVKVYSNWVTYSQYSTEIDSDEPYTIVCDDRKNN
ncbi:hypothetical protein FDC45_07920 [Clostridium botulinum]|uniref:Uncharacterized protein n=1 Tax=Clostridium botulinum TaxID=1491 RepID=A0A846J3X8_CLOBO|nr:hypothetical protein [Clostridium botulinum]ACA53809.1 conserved hypothetical protein [Clostridium botulinum A3 str. Loch Maree]NFH66279.1 hypothetical protein [Clostridium botulinum]NFJ08786.1 hypothetical protein [Clostridium botulinum]NFK15182.1 hypothetical protein [Clostridium botulinum]NFM95733.1 hypothetical protein [Clostridium botulinum]